MDPLLSFYTGGSGHLEQAAVREQPSRSKLEGKTLFLNDLAEKAIDVPGDKTDVTEIKWSRTSTRAAVRGVPN
jgi:hypothetical protein